MPTVSLALDNINKFIVTNSIYNIALELAGIIKIYNNLDIVTMYRGDEITLTDGRANITTNQIGNVPTTIAARRLLVNIIDTYNEDALTTTATHGHEQYPIFIDDDIDVNIFPIYLQTDYTITFTFYTPSRNEIEKVVDDIRMRLSQTRNIFVHDIEYDYVLPEVVEDFIADVHINKSRLAPQTLQEYFQSCSTRRIHLISDLVGSNARLAVREKQTRIVGIFDFSPMPDKPEKDNNIYKFTFDYKFTIDKPSSLVMKYPVMVCNQLLPPKYMDFLVNRNSKQERFKPLSYNNSLYALSYFESHRQLENRINIDLPLNVPEIDEFKKKRIHKGYSVIVSFLSQIDETDNKTLLNLTELDPYYIDADILAYITLELNYVVHPYSSFVYVGLYQEGKYFNMDTLEIDSLYNVRSTVALDLFKPTRVLLNYCLDVSSINEHARNRLLTYPTPVIVSVLKEIVYNITNFKEETKDINEYALHRLFLLVINELIKRQDIEVTAPAPSVVNPADNFINTLLKHLYVADFYIFNKVMSNFYSNHRESIYNYLAKNTEVIKYYTTNNTYKDYESNVYNVMKTVETGYVVALRRNDGLS